MQVAQDVPNIVLKDTPKLFQIIIIFFRRRGLGILGTKNWGSKFRNRFYSTAIL